MRNKLILKMAMAGVLLNFYSQAGAIEPDGSGTIPEGIRALYLFNETTGDVLDTSGVQPALDLEVVNPAGVVRGAGFINIKQDTYVRSKTAASKIVSQCKSSNEVTIEAWIQPNRSAKLPETIPGDPFPLTIVGLGSAATANNGVILSQFYEDSDIYRGIYRTTAGAEVSSSTTVGVVEVGALQHIYLVRSRDGFSKMFVSDSVGRNVPRVTSAVGGTFNWDDNSLLTIGQRAFMNPMATAPEKFSWKGEIHMLAVYCRALADSEIMGELLPKPVYQAITPLPNEIITPYQEQAALLYKRLVGVKTPIDNPVITAMAKQIELGQLRGAANLATAENGFYNITVRDFASRMSTRDETVNAGLNDFVAGFIGTARDDRSAKELLTGNFYYAGDPLKTAVASNLVNDLLKSNRHYEQLDSQGYDLANVLKRYDSTTGNGQKVYNGKGGVVDSPETAGVLTSRAFMEAHAVAGTNRRLVEFSFREFLCVPIEKWSDATGPDNMVGMDIDRFPGGDHSKFKVSCRSCHSSMDGLRPAFAKWTFSSGFAKNASIISPGDNDDDEGTMKQDPIGIAAKYNQNSDVFKGGNRVVATAFVNNAIRGANADYFGWGSTLTGTGLNDYGKMISDSKAFPRCMAQRAFRSVCKREPASFDQPMLTRVANEFATNGFKLRDLFERVAISPECLGGK